MEYTLTYKLINNGTEYEVSGYTGNYFEVVIPSEYKGLPVTSIGNAAFKGCRAWSIKIPDSVTNISTSAFYNCTGVTDIVIPSSVTNIGNYAFDNCENLTSVVIPDSVTSIGSAVFDDCSSLKSITVSTGNANYKSIDGNLYTKNGKTLLQYASGKTATSFAIPDSVTSIGAGAIKACGSLMSIIIPDSVTSIGSSAFSGCSILTSITVSKGNANYKSIDGNLYTKDGKTLVQYAIGKTENPFAIPDSVTSIGEYAFYGCYRLMSIIIPDSVTSIGVRAFQGCSGLTSVTIPDSVTSIGEYAFQNCSELMGITLLAKTPADISSDVFSHISANAKFYCYSSALQSYKTATNWNTYANANKFVADDMRLYFTMNSIALKNYITSYVGALELRVKALEEQLANRTTTEDITSVFDEEA